MRAASSLRWIGSVVFVGLVASVVLSGCRPGTALHSRYNDFRAYYNAYYNAEQKLEEGEETLQARNQRVDRGRLVELFPTGSASGRGGTFQETVDKSAELLRDRPGSKWADDALLLIGKAYFYQRNFVGAEQKFRETAEAAEVRSDPRLADEARFWLGRTYAATERYDEGVAVLQDALAQTEIDPRWQAQIQLALGELYGRAERWQDAADAIRAGLETVGDRELATRAYLLLGQVEEVSGNWDAAAEAYALAARRATAYELEYAARLSEALVLGLDAGRSEESIERIRAMRRDDKNFQQRAEVELAWARIQAASGDAPGARRRFLDVLYDENLAGGTIRGEAHFRLAEFYRDVEKDFIRASAHFDTAATALPAPPDASVQLSRSAIRDARRESETFTSIAVTSQRVAEIDSLVTLASLSEEEFAARIEMIEANRLQAFLDAQRETNQLRANEAFRNQGDTGRSAAGPANVDSELLRSASGFLGHRDPATVQAGQIAFEQTWGDRPLLPNWRRLAAIAASSIETATGATDGAVRARTGSGQGPPPLDLSAIPRTPQQKAELAVELSELRYELANALFLSLGRADSAVVLYRSILKDTPDAPVAARARYALAEIEFAAGRLEAATPLFEAVIEADPESSLAQAARSRLGIAEPEVLGVEPEISDRSADRFAAARLIWTEGDPLGAMQAFVALGEANPEAPIAPRAFLAGAAAYADFARGDSLILMAALPDSLAPALFRDTTDTLEPVDEPEAEPGDPQLDAPARLPDEDTPLPDEDKPLPDDDLRRERRGLPVTRVGVDDVVDEDAAAGADSLLARPAELPTPVEEDALDADEIKEPRTDAPRPVGTPVPVEMEVDADELALETDVQMPSGEPMADSVSMPTDSLNADAPRADSLTVESLPVDALAVSVALDSLGGITAPDSLASDSLMVPGPPPFTLADYLDALAERYPDTIEANQARALSAALPRPEPPPAPVLEAVEEPEAELSEAPELVEEAVLPDEDIVSQPAAPPTPVDLDASPYGTYGTQPLNPTVGGFSRRTNALADAAEASELVRQLVEEGYRAAVGTDGEDIFVVVGQFPTDKALAIASAELPAATLGSGTGIVRLEDIQLLPLVNGEDGR